MTVRLLAFAGSTRAGSLNQALLDLAVAEIGGVDPPPPIQGDPRGRAGPHTPPSLAFLRQRPHPATGGGTPPPV